MNKQVKKTADEILKESVLPAPAVKVIDKDIDFVLSQESLKILLEAVRQIPGFTNLKEKVPSNFAAIPIITLTVSINPSLTSAIKFENTLKDEIRKNHFRFEIKR